MISSESFKRYVSKVVYTEKCNIPGGKKLPDNVTWNIVKKASKNAFLQIYKEYSKFLNNSSLEYTKPTGTSFRIYPPENSCIYFMGVRKIIISLNLIKNDDILRRLREKDYIIEISINDSSEKYLESDILGYTKDSFFKEFNCKNFQENIQKGIEEVYRLLTFQIFSQKSRG